MHRILLALFAAGLACGAAQACTTNDVHEKMSHFVERYKELAQKHPDKVRDVATKIQVAMERHAGAARSAALAALWVPQVRRAERLQRRRADGLVELLALGAFRDKFVSELSTGSRRLVDLACVLAAGPEVLLLDEPAAGIAQAEAEELPGTLERIRRETGCAMLVIEHDVRLLTTVADRLVGMVLGATIADGPAETVLSDPALVAAYLGSSERAVARSGDLAATMDPEGSPQRSAR